VLKNYKKRLGSAQPHVLPFARINPLVFLIQLHNLNLVLPIVEMGKAHEEGRSDSFIK
jgi:hypothetical protein